jgi:hypothetical protein
MKKIYSCIIILMAYVQLFGQNNLGKTDDIGRISLSVYIPDQVEGLPEISKDFLDSKLGQIVSESGFGSSSMENRFIITPKIAVVNKNITTDSPSYTIIDLELTLNMGDGISGIKFDSYTFKLKGVGLNDIKAYQAAFKLINSKDPLFKQFIAKGKNNIIQYFNDRCDYLQTQANSLASRNQHDEAILYLSSVPEVCKECYSTSLNNMVKIYEDKLEFECAKNLAQAKSLVLTGKFDKAYELLAFITPRQKCYSQTQELLIEIQNRQCATFLAKAKASWAVRNAEEAQSYLKEISSDSKCSQEALALIKEISTWYKINENRAWEFELKKQKDQTDIRFAEINAIRQVAIAEAKNRPRVYLKYNIYHW